MIASTHRGTLCQGSRFFFRARNFGCSEEGFWGGCSLFSGWVRWRVCRPFVGGKSRRLEPLARSAIEG